MSAYTDNELRRDYIRTWYTLSIIEERIRNGKSVYGDEMRVLELRNQMHCYEAQMDANGVSYRV